MEDNFNKYRRITKKRKEEAQQRYVDASADRLSKVVETKIRTTFIGAISRMEEKFGHLWGMDTDTPSASQLKMRKAWNELRNAILDHGNNQLRALRKELAQYDVSWNRYHIDLEPDMGDRNFFDQGRYS